MIHAIVSVKYVYLIPSHFFLLLFYRFRENLHVIIKFINEHYIHVDVIVQFYPWLYM